MYDKQALIALVREKSLKFGDFTLASGKKAKYYLDGKQVTLDSHGAKLVAEGILDLLGDDLPRAVGGMSIGADRIALYLMIHLALLLITLPFFWMIQRNKTQ